MRDRLGARAGGGGAASPTLGQFQNATLSLGTWPVALASPSGVGELRCPRARALCDLWLWGACRLALGLARTGPVRCLLGV